MDQLPIKQLQVYTHNGIKCALIHAICSGVLSNRTLHANRQTNLPPIPRLFCFSVYQTKLQDSGAIAQTNIITRRKEQNNSSSCMVANVMDANVHPILDGRVLDVVDASSPHGVHADCRDFRVVR